MNFGILGVPAGPARGNTTSYKGMNLEEFGRASENVTTDITQEGEKMTFTDIDSTADLQVKLSRGAQGAILSITNPETGASPDSMSAPKVQASYYGVETYDSLVGRTFVSPDMGVSEVTVNHSDAMTTISGKKADGSAMDVIFLQNPKYDELPFG